MKSARIREVVAVIATASSAWAASPCDGVNRSLTTERKMVLAPEIAKQFQFKSVDVLQSFQASGWSIFYVDTHESDDVYMFYAHDPLTSRYISLWSGAAKSNEEQTIKAQTLVLMPSIPRRLASCFAWHITKGRDQ
jgi:hypothetical protein